MDEVYGSVGSMRATNSRKRALVEFVSVFALGCLIGMLFTVMTLSSWRDKVSEVVKSINGPVEVQFETFKKDLDVAFPHLAKRVDNLEQIQGRMLQEMRMMALNYLAMDKACAERFGDRKWVESLENARQAVTREVEASQKAAQNQKPPVK